MIVSIRSPRSFTSLPTLVPAFKKCESPIDICHISAAAFRLNLEQKQNIVYSLTLNEVDQELQRRDELDDPEDDPNNDALVDEILPPEHAKFKDVFSKASSDVLPPHRSYDHRIELSPDADLKAGPLYSQSATELAAVKEYLVDNLKKGFIEPSQSPWSSPVLFVKKPNGSLRFCIDYRGLNQFTKKDKYPLPLIDETLAHLNKARVFSKLDIRQAFHRIRMDPDSEGLTTFRTRYGSYKCKVVPFGLTNSPATYQRYRNDTLFDYLDVFCTAYLDDFIIYSDDPLDHPGHVSKVLARLRSAGLQVDIKKCEFNVKSTKYLGFIVSTDGISTDPEKIAVLLA